MDGQVHYRVVGRISPEMPTPYVERPVTGRAIWAHLVPVGTVATVTPRNGGEPYREWFSRGALQMAYPPPVFSLNHLSDGGVKLGKVVQLIEGVAWTDGVMLVDDSAAGDAFLETVGPDGGDLPISIGFRPIASVTYPEGILRTKVALTEVSVVEAATYGFGSRTYARGHLPPPMSWKSRDPRKDRVAG